MQNPWGVSLNRYNNIMKLSDAKPIYKDNITGKITKAGYVIVHDQGGNIGLQCPLCNQARWKSNHDALDWSTGKDCENCAAMVTNGDFEVERIDEDIVKAKQEAADEEAKLVWDTERQNKLLAEKKARIAKAEQDEKAKADLKEQPNGKK